MPISIIPLMGTLILPATNQLVDGSQGVRRVIDSVNETNESTLAVSYDYEFTWVTQKFFPHMKPPPNKIDKNYFANTILTSIPGSLQWRVIDLLHQTLEMCQWYNMDPLWIISIMWVEGHFNPLAKSSVGAIGLMQVKPSTGKYIAKIHEDEELNKVNMTELRPGFYRYQKKEDFYPPLKKDQKIWNSKTNLELGILYLRFLFKNFNQDPSLATMAYNMGPHGVRKELLNRSRGIKKNLYLEKVLKNYEKLVKNFN